MKASAARVVRDPVFITYRLDALSTECYKLDVTN